jgi:hypothetical protein
VTWLKKGDRLQQPAVKFRLHAELLGAPLRKWISAGFDRDLKAKASL